MEVRIFYEDTDAGGVVYYANYLRYLERARTLYLEEKGIYLDKLSKEDVLFTVVKVEIEYKSKAEYGDILKIESEVIEVSKIALFFDHKILNNRDGKVVVLARVKLVCVNREGKLRKIPEEIKEKLTINYG